MAALFDAASGNSGENVTSLSWTHTPVGTPTGVAVCVGWWTAPTPAIASITYGGVAMALAVAIDNSADERSAIYGLASPPAGPQTVLITWDASAYVVGIAVTVTGGHASTLFSNTASAVGESTAPSVGCTSAVGELVIDFTVGDEPSSSTVPTYTPGAGQTQRGYQQTGGIGAQASTEAGAAGTVTMSQTASASVKWAQTAASFKEADASVMAVDTGYFVLTGSDISFTLSAPTTVRNVPCYALLIQNADLTGPAHHYVTAQPNSGGVVPSGSFETAPEILIPEGIERSADPRESRFDTGTMTFTLRDPDGIVTAAVANFPGKQCILYTWDYTESFSLAEFMFVGIVQDFAYSDAGYRITARSPIVLADTTLFNGGRTEILAGIGPADLSVTVADASGFAATGVLLVESERIAYTIRVDNGTSWTLSGLTRGHLSSAAASHAAGVTVVENFVLGPAHPYTLIRDMFRNPADGKVGIGMPTYVNDDNFAAQIAAVGSTFEMFFEVTESANAKAWIEEKILKVMGALPFENNLGHTGIKSFSAASSTVDSIGDAHCLQRAEWRGNFPRRVNSVTYLYDKDAVTGEYLSSYPVTDDGLIARDGLLPIVIEADGIHSSLSSAVALMEARGRAYIEKFGLQLPTMSARTIFAKRFLESADDVAVTFERMANLSTGVVGVTSGPAEIIASRINFQDNTVEFELLEHGPIFDVFADGPVMTADTSSFTESIGTAVNPYTMVLDTAYYTLTGNAVNLNYSGSSPTYYVSLTGSDSTGTGSISSPWRTIKYGVSQLVPGNTLLIRAGIYVEQINTQVGDVVPSGSSGNVITIQPYPGETVTMAPSNGSTLATLVLQAVSYTTWKGIIFDNAGLTYDGAAQDVLAMVGSSNNRFEDCEFKNSLCNSIQVGLSSNNNVFLRCNSHSFGQSFPVGHPLYNLRDDHGIYINQNSSGNIIDGGEYHDGFGWGVHVYNSGLGGLDNTIVRNVKAYNCGYRNGIANVRKDMTGILVTDGDDCLVYNNLAYNNLGPGIVIAGLGPADNTGVYNNTVYNNGHADGWDGIIINANATNCLVTNNISYLNAASPISNLGGATLLTNLITNPLFTNAGSYDFTTQAGSAARNAGTSLAGIFTTDIAGTARPQGAAWDIGAYEAA